MEKQKLEIFAKKLAKIRNKNNKTKQFNCRITPQQLEQFKANAAAAGMGGSGFFIKMCISYHDTNN